MSDKGLSEEDVAAACKDADPKTKVRLNISLNSSHRNFCRCQNRGRPTAATPPRGGQAATGPLLEAAWKCQVFTMFCSFLDAVCSRESGGERGAAVEREQVAACGC